MKALPSLIIALGFLLSPSAIARPNILLILADDLGWADTGCYGNPWFQTPHLDRLAAEGARFTHAYSAAPICSASRAALLTGKTTARLGFEFVTKPEPGFQPVNAPLRAPPFTLDLPLEEITIAECLGEAGYTTGFFGKWHLNQHYQRYLGWSPTHGPKAQGFQVAEEDFGNHPYSYWNQKSNRTFRDDLAEGEFPEDSMTQRAIRFLGREHEQPFFLMVSHFYVHDPNHTRLRWLHDRYLEAVPADHSRRDKLAHYGAMVTTLDHHVGELLDALEKSGHAEETLVIFTSDNGGHPNYAGNAPLRGSKWNLYEGGIRVPFLARWPGRIQAGTTNEAVIWSIDLFPTFAALAGATAPAELDGENLLPILEDAELDAKEDWRKRPMVWHFPYYHPEKGYDEAPEEIGIDDGLTSKTKPHSTVRLGPWKLLHFYEDERDELYDLAGTDIENKEIARFYDGQAESAREELRRYLEEVGARMPRENPDYQPSPAKP